MEKHVHDVLEAVYDMNGTTLAPTLLNGCVPGSDNYQRIGRRTGLLSLHIRGFVYPESLVTGQIAYAFRMVVVYDKQANGAAPVWSDVVLSQNAAGATSSGPLDMINLVNQDRFEIVRDVTYSAPFTSPSAGASDNNSVMIDEFLDLGGRPTIYNAGTAGTIADINSGSLYIFWVTTNVSATVGIDVDVSYRTQYYDY